MYRLLLILIVLLACRNSSGETDENRKRDSGISDSSTTNRTDENKSDATKKFNTPLDIFKIKEEFPGTSGVCGKQCSQLCKPEAQGFFGTYSLLDSNEKKIGSLTVFCTDSLTNWKSDTKNETFAEIQFSGAGITVWDSISVGTAEDELLHFIGDNFHYVKGHTIFADLGDYKAHFKIDKRKVSAITVGRYCK